MNDFRWNFCPHCGTEVKTITLRMNPPQSMAILVLDEPLTIHCQCGGELLCKMSVEVLPKPQP